MKMKRTIFVPAFVLLAALSALAQPTKHNEETVAQLQAEMAAGKLTSVALTNFYITRILTLDQNGPGVNSVIELNPDALEMARNADALRAKGTVLGPLHGIPVLLKDNIDTGDRMQTTAGSFALAGEPALQDSTVAAKLRAGGAVILGKTNLSEWANFRSLFSSSGWSGRGGLVHNPYSLAASSLSERLLAEPSLLPCPSVFQFCGKLGGAACCTARNGLLVGSCRNSDLIMFK